MPNDITVTKNETPGSERWDVAYTADQAATVTKTMDTAGTMLDRDIKVSVTIPSGKVTAPSTISADSAVVTVGTNTLTLSKNVSTTSVVATEGYVNSGTTRITNVSLSGSVNTQAAQTIHPSTTDQTIASGKYLTGAQTIKAVTLSNLSAGNIKKDVVVKVGDSDDDDRIISVTGTYEGSGATLQAKTNINPTTSSQTITPDTGYDGLSSVQINAMPNGSVTAPSTITGSTATSAVGTLAMAIPQLRLVELSQSVSVTPDVTTAGYISNGTAGTSTVKTYAQLDGILDSSVYITPGTTDKFIATAGYYYIGSAKVAGDANLVPANIADGVSIFGVAGTLAFSTIYSGSSAPSSSTGVDGDIYLQV